MMRKPISARIEFVVSERFVVKHERGDIGRASNLLLKQPMNAQVLRISDRRVVPRLDEQGTGFGRQHIEPVHGCLRCLFESLYEARKCLLHVAAQLFGRERRDGLRGETKALAVVFDRQHQRIVGAFFGTEQLDAVEDLLLIGRRLIVSIIEQGAEERRGCGDTTASLCERERCMLMLQQSGETFMGLTHAIDDRSIGDIEANRQCVDQEPQRLIDARLHASEQHGAEDDAAIGIERTGRAEHAGPRKMTQARETHAIASSLSTQTRIERCGQCHARFGDG
ncbi:hypothetical protein AWB76_07836 [Caballeronia temeraria]|uniref:Uncharacterized protein n=1 Tax=Caballeronia temeraria TaxID=1777137 RepID=A0A158E009_9BURK|nr:hypothetical protein AWB76_07836 [Caballeronia temeraria]